MIDGGMDPPGKIKAPVSLLKHLHCQTNKNEKLNETQLSFVL